MKSAFAWLVAMGLAVALTAVAVPRLSPTPVAAPTATGAAAPVAVAGGPALSTVAGSVRRVVEQTKPAVVQITSEQVKLDKTGLPVAEGRGVGSGVIYDASGLILTNNHVVDGARSLMVSLPDGRTFVGELLGGDPQMDLAVVRIQPAAGEPLPVAKLGVSSELAVGDAVVAIGNALGLPGGPTVTAGVVSALGRAIQEPSETPGQPGPYLYDLIQTDAAINPGNSGGPLFNLAGEVVGINTLGAGGDEVMAQGIGFAIAIDAARPIADQLASGGKVVHPFLGIGYGLLTPAIAAQLELPVKQGVVVGQVVQGSPAERAGLRPRDVIVAVDGLAIVDETTLGRALNQRRPGERAGLAIARGAERLTLEVTLGERPTC